MEIIYTNKAKMTYNCEKIIAQENMENKVKVKKIVKKTSVDKCTPQR